MCANATEGDEMRAGKHDMSPLTRRAENAFVGAVEALPILATRSHRDDDEFESCLCTSRTHWIGSQICNFCWRGRGDVDCMIKAGEVSVAERGWT